MIDKFGPIRNPLTIIAVFAGTAEISGTGILPFIAAPNQRIFVWFLIVFPTLLVVAFFLTLNFNHHVLYAPSDFKDEENFFREASAWERDDKVAAEIGDAVSVPLRGADFSVDSERSDGEIPSRYLERDEYIRIERMVFDRLSREMGQRIRTGVKLGVSKPFVLDGMVFGSDGVTAIEVRFVLDRASSISRLGESVRRMQDAVDELPSQTRDSFSLVLAVVTDKTAPHLMDSVRSAVGAASFPVQVRLFSVDELERSTLDQMAV